MITIALFFLPLVVTYVYDKHHEKKINKETAQLNIGTSNNATARLDDMELRAKVLHFDTLDFYRILIEEKKGMPVKNYDE